MVNTATASPRGLSLRFVRSLFLIGFFVFVAVAAPTSRTMAMQIIGDRSYPIGIQLEAVQVTDLTRDGIPDVVAGTVAGVTISTGHVTGNGTLNGATLNAGATLAEQTVVGDMNNDGIPDAVSSGVPGLIFVRLGNPSGALNAPAGFGAGGHVDAIALADLNRDGSLDVVSVTTSIDGVYVLNGSPSGSLGIPFLYTTGGGSAPVSVVAADINLDGRVDVAAATSTGISYLPGLAFGVLGAPVFHGGQGGNSHIASGDINHDSYPDLVCSNPTSSFLTLYTGGSSGVSYHSTPFAGAPTRNAEVMDVNLDGKNDVVCSLAAAQSVMYLNGNGTGSLVVAGSAGSTTGVPWGLDAGDINLDGRMDVVTGEKTSGNITVMRGYVPNAGLVAYPPQTNQGPASGFTSALVSGEFNKNGTVDLCVGQTNGVANLYNNNGAGVFNLSGPGSAIAVANQMVNGDFNGDGALDIAVATAGVGLQTLYNTGASFAGVQINVGGNACPCLVAADFNLDGRLDVAISESNTARTYSCLGNGTTLVVTGTLVGTGSPTRSAAGDLNRDGLPDVAVVNFGSDSFDAFMGTGAGNFTLTASPLVPEPVDVQIGDANRDDRLDVIIATSTTPANNSMNVFPGNGNGTFQALVHAPISAIGLFREILDDYNLDGKLDVLGVGTCGNPAALLGNGLGRFLPDGSVSIFLACGVVDVAGGDFNRDGLPDIAALKNSALALEVFLSQRPTGYNQLSSSNNMPASSEVIYVHASDTNLDGRDDLVTTDFSNSTLSTRFNSNVNNNFGPEVPTTVGAQPRPGILADVNQDGWLDAVSPSQTTNQVTVKFGIGGGAYGAPMLYNVGLAPFAIAAGDLNQDGSPDLVTANFGSNTLSLLFNTGGGIYSPGVTLAAGLQPNAVAISDFNGDGLKDVVAGMYGTNLSQVFFALGGGIFSAPANYTLPAGSRVHGLDLGDLDQNGAIDMATANFSSDTISLYYNLGNGTFNPNHYFSPGGPISVTISDFNADSILDFVIGNNSNDSMVFWFAQSPGSFIFPQHQTTPRGIRNLAVGDFDLNGRPDLAGATFQGRTMGIYMNYMALPVSVSNYGFGTPGCTGRLVMNASKKPAINTADFAFNCTGMPRNMLGLGLVTDTTDLIGNDFFGLFVTMHLDFVNMTEFYYFNIYSDNWGVGSGPVPIPNDGSLVGNVYYVQTLAFESPTEGEACSTSLYKGVTSLGLQLTIQP